MLECWVAVFDFSLASFVRCRLPDSLCQCTPLLTKLLCLSVCHLPLQALSYLRAGSMVASVVTCCLWRPVLACGCSRDKVSCKRILALPSVSSPTAHSVLSEPPAPALMLPCQWWQCRGSLCPWVGNSAGEQFLLGSCNGYLKSFASELRLQARNPKQKTTRGLFHPWHLGHWLGTKMCPSVFLFSLKSFFFRSPLSWCKIPTSPRNRTVNTWTQERMHLVLMWNPPLIQYFSFKEVVMNTSWADTTLLASAGIKP